MNELTAIHAERNTEDNFIVSVRAWVELAFVITPDNHHAPCTRNAFIIGHARDVTEHIDVSCRSCRAALADAEFFLHVEHPGG